jgi:hypothetical protein
MRQVQTINDVLHMERQRCLSELIKTNIQIQQKLTILKKILFYQASYHNQALLKTGQAVAVEQYNLQLIFKKITQLIIGVETEITRLSVVSRALSDRIGNIDRKIQLTNMFEKQPK